MNQHSAIGAVEQEADHSALQPVVYADNFAFARKNHRLRPYEDLNTIANDLSEFKRSLNENTIQEIAGLSAELNKQDRTIRDRIATINTCEDSMRYAT